MLVDTHLEPSTWLYLFHGLGMLGVLGLIFCSGWYLIYCIGLSVIFLLLDGWWLRRQIRQRVIQLWQQDQFNWCWQQSGQPRHRGQLYQVQHTAFWVYLNLRQQQRSTRLLLWRDQMPQEEWRKLIILSQLKKP